MENETQDVDWCLLSSSLKVLSCAISRVLCYDLPSVLSYVLPGVISSVLPCVLSDVSLMFSLVFSLVLSPVFSLMFSLMVSLIGLTEWSPQNYLLRSFPELLTEVIIENEALVVH